MTSPGPRQDSTFERLMKEAGGRRLFQIVSGSVRRIRGADRGDDGPKGVDGGAEVLRGLGS